MEEPSPDTYLGQLIKPMVPGAIWEEMEAQDKTPVFAKREQVLTEPSGGVLSKSETA